MAFKRNCPVCECDLIYKSKKSFYNAKWKNAPCKSCAQIGHTAWNKGLTKTNDSRVAQYSKGLRKAWGKAKKNKSRVSWNKGLSADYDIRVHNNTLKTRSTLLELYSAGTIAPWNKGKPFPQVAGENSPSKRPEVREKMAKAALHLKNKKYKCTFNPEACKLFDAINQEMKWSGLHAMNNPDGEYRVYSTMFHVDFYEPNLNIVIEYYEKSHNRTKQKAKDIIRQQRIIDVLKCTFYIIKQGEEHLWRQTIQQQFWSQVERGSLGATLRITA